MPLPKIDQPLFVMSMPSNDKKYNYRPFSVKEEKILLIAQESKDTEQTINSIKQVINNCVIDIDIEKLPLFDIEYALIKIRSKSVNNIIEFSVKDPETEEKVDLKLDLEDVKVARNENHTNKIQVSDNAIITMKYPNVNQLSFIMNNENDTDSIFSVMTSCLDKLVMDEDEVYKFSDYTDEEITNFIENLSGEVLSSIKDFFETMPKIRHEMKYVNKEGKEKTFVLEGLDSFFI